MLMRKSVLCSANVKESFVSMNENQNFTRGSILGKMLRFMLPVLGALLMQSLYGAVDLLVVGQYGTTTGISAVSTGSMIMHAITMIITALATAVTVMMGHHLGGDTPEKIGKLLGNALALFSCIAILLTVVMTVFARPIAIAMQAPDEALDLTVQYIRICGAGFVFVVFYNFISSVFRGMGNSRLPLLFVLIAGVINIFGDLILVAVFHMNVAGAALATIFAQAVSVVLSLFVVRRTKLPFHIQQRHFSLGTDAKKILKIGGPLALQELLTSIGMLAMCAFINRMGLDASSGYGVAQKIHSFVLLIPMSIMQCMAPFVSQNVGAQREDRAKRAVVCGIGIGVATGLCMAAAIFFKGDLLSTIFTNDSRVIVKAFEYLRGFAPEAFLTCILFSLLGYFNGHTKTMFVMWVSLGQTFLVKLPVSYFMSIHASATLTGVALAGPISTFCGIIVCLLYFCVLQKQMRIDNKLPSLHKEP